MKKIIISSIACVLLVLFILGLWLLGIGYFKDEATREMIQLSEISNKMYINDKPNIPDWEIEKISAYNDYFTSPTCTVYFSNGIELLLSTGPVNYSGMNQIQEEIGKNEYKTFISKPAKVYQYNEGRLYYSFRIMREQEKEIMEKYLKTLKFRVDSK